jgi:CopG family nickel-responsive transcriptional regulator
VHLDHHHCLEIIAVRGKARDVERLSTSLKALVGVKHLSLSISQSGDEAD